MKRIASSIKMKLFGVGVDVLVVDGELMHFIGAALEGDEGFVGLLGHFGSQEGWDWEQL